MPKQFRGVGVLDNPREESTDDDEGEQSDDLDRGGDGYEQEGEATMDEEEEQEDGEQSDDPDCGGGDDYEQEGEATMVKEEQESDDDYDPDDETNYEELEGEGEDDDEDDEPKPGDTEEEEGWVTTGALNINGEIHPILEYDNGLSHESVAQVGAANIPLMNKIFIQLATVKPKGYQASNVRTK